MTSPRRPVRNTDLLESPVVVPESLRPWLTELGRIPTVTDVSGAFVHIPQTTTTIVVRTETSGRRAAFVVGPQTRASYTATESAAGCVRMRLAPGTSRQLLGVAAGDLADNVFRLRDMPGAIGQLADELVELGSEEIVSFLESVLPQRISESDTQRAHRELLHGAVSAIARGAPSGVPELAADLAVSERQLRNLFAAGIGVSPKHFERITRVRRVIARAGDASWAELASSTGFYDQSHLSSEFRALMGVPPATYFRGELPPPSACRVVGEANSGYVAGADQSRGNSLGVGGERNVA
ncbi:helix-turn-helix domain-containing protein [Nocardia sp. NPDC050406]|uniref:helix-turn-helix domain-containing protein n=1 Tax=Nocardia sp. NPDC050406 TaxID=3364318 RepID=UPI0037A6A71E